MTCFSCLAGGFFTAKPPGKPIFMDREGGLCVMTEFHLHVAYQGDYSDGDSNLKIHRVLKPTDLHYYFPNDFIRNVLQTAYVGIIYYVGLNHPELIFFVDKKWSSISNFLSN